MDSRDPGKEYAIPQDNPYINDPSGGVLSILEIRRVEPEQDKCFVPTWVLFL